MMESIIDGNKIQIYIYTKLFNGFILKNKNSNKSKEL
jgi:hypothetical protein